MFVVCLILNQYQHWPSGSFQGHMGVHKWNKNKWVELFHYPHTLNFCFQIISHQSLLTSSTIYLVVLRCPYVQNWQFYNQKSLFNVFHIEFASVLNVICIFCWKHFKFFHFFLFSSKFLKVSFSVKVLFTCLSVVASATSYTQHKRATFSKNASSDAWWCTILTSEFKP